MDGAQEAQRSGARRDSQKMRRRSGAHQQAHGCAGGRLHITQITRRAARTADGGDGACDAPVRRHGCRRSIDPSAGADTAGARNFWRYVTRPPIAPRAAAASERRSAGCRGERGWGKQTSARARSPSGWPKSLFGVGCNAVQPRCASGRDGLAEGPVRRRLERAALSRAVGLIGVAAFITPVRFPPWQGLVLVRCPSVWSGT